MSDIRQVEREAAKDEYVAELRAENERLRSDRRAAADAFSELEAKNARLQAALAMIAKGLYPGRDVQEFAHRALEGKGDD